MSILLNLSALALRGAVGRACEAVCVPGGGVIVDGVVAQLKQRFSDHSQRLTKALQRANDRAWRTVELALAGDSWWQRCKARLGPADERAFGTQLRAFLDANPLPDPAGGRDTCLAQLQAARRQGLLTGGSVGAGDLAKLTGSLARFAEPSQALAADRKLVARVADEVRRTGYEALADLLELRPSGGLPLLATAVRYFFQREVESDPQLFAGLAWTKLEELSAGQQEGFRSLGEALDQHGGKLAELLSDVREVVTRTAEDVLDIKTEMAKQGRQVQELASAVLRALEEHQLARRELRPQDSLSVRSPEERALVRQLIGRYRAMPAGERREMPALLNAVGKLEVVAGDFEAAREDFAQLAAVASDAGVRAEASHNAYNAALAQRAWGEALAALRQAAHEDPARFAPFPPDKFEAEKILGAGGFGVAFLCRNKNSGGRVVIKTLRAEGAARDLKEVFREARVLEELDHPAIIRIRDCDYADAAKRRPFVVMDYFAGPTLAQYVAENGPLPVDQALGLARLVAEGMREAHRRGILHRDLKPANLLVRRVATKTGATWEAKLIDFGLAHACAAATDTQGPRHEQTMAGGIAGTLDYGAPEQLGRLVGVSVAPCSDVYAFGKTCCFALFGTPQPTFQHWKQLPPALAELLGRCLAETPSERPADFAEVLRELERAQRPRPAVKPRQEEVELPVLRKKETPPPTRERDEERRPRRKAAARPPKVPVLALVGGGALVVLLLVALVAFWVVRAAAKLTAPLESPPVVRGTPERKEPNQKPDAPPQDGGPPVIGNRNAALVPRDPKARADQPFGTFQRYPLEVGKAMVGKIDVGDWEVQCLPGTEWTSYAMLAMQHHLTNGVLVLTNDTGIGRQAGIASKGFLRGDYTVTAEVLNISSVGLKSADGDTSWAGVEGLPRNTWSKVRFARNAGTVTVTVDDKPFKHFDQDSDKLDAAVFYLHVATGQSGSIQYCKATKP